jgi:hypothetical protein
MPCAQFLAAGLLIALCGSTNATAREHYSKPRQFVARPGGATPPVYNSPSYVAPGGARNFRDDSVPGGVRTYRDDPPPLNDPSKRGGA